MEVVRATVFVLRDAARGDGGSREALDVLDDLRTSGEFPVVLANVLVGDGLMYQGLDDADMLVVTDLQLRQVAGLLLKQVVKCASSVDDVEEQLLRSLCDESAAIRNAAAGCISSMLSSESLAIWPSLAEKLQMMVDHGTEATFIGVTKCVCLVCEDNAHELSASQFLPIQEALFRTICALIDHDNSEVRLNCFSAVRDIMRVVFAGDDDGDIDGGNYKYSDLGGSDEDEDEHTSVDSVARRNIDLLASVVSPRLVDAYSSVVSDTSSVGEHFRQVLLECSMAMLSQWRHLMPLLPALLPLVVTTMKNASQGGEVSATLAAEFVADIAQGIELGAHDVIVENLHDILEGLLAAVTLDDFTISFFNINDDCDEPDDEPNVNILGGRFDESTAIDEDDDGGAQVPDGDADESDVSGGGLRPQAKWCLNCLSVAVPDELLGAVSDVFGFVIAADDNVPRGWIRREAALTMLAELVDELFPRVPSEGVAAVAETCEKLITHAPCSLLRAAALRCLAHMLHGQVSALLDCDEDDDERTRSGSTGSLDPLVGFGVITMALRDGNKYVQRVALEIVTSNLEAAFAACEELSESSDIDARLAMFGHSSQTIETLLTLLMDNFPRYQLQSRVLTLTLFGLLATHDCVHGAVGRHISDLMSLIAHHWDSLPHLCYENAAVMNCLCDILEAVDVEVVLQAMQGVAQRCKTLCQVARESSKNNSVASAADIASLALDTVSTMCDRCGTACVEILDEEMMDHVAHFAATCASPSEFQATRAALAVLGDCVQVCSLSESRLQHLAPMVFPLLAGVCVALNELPSRLRGNAMYAVAQWTHLAMTSAGTIQCDAESAAQIAQTVAIVAHELFSAPALSRSIFSLNTAFAALTLTSQGAGVLQPEDQHRLIVAAAKIFDQIDDEEELALNLGAFCMSVVASLTSGFIPCDELIVRAVVTCAELAARNVDVSNQIHEQLKELLLAMAGEVGMDSIVSTMTSAQRRLLRNRYLQP